MMNRVRMMLLEAVLVPMLLMLGLYAVASGAAQAASLLARMVCARIGEFTGGMLEWGGKGLFAL